MKALIVGGTGPTGPGVIEALLARGYEVSILHRGVHEPTGVPVLTEVEHLHADPNFVEPLQEATAGRSFDVVVAMYGRMAINAEVFAGRCDRLISVGGNPAHRGHLNRASAWPDGMRILANESDPLTEATATTRDRFATKVVAAEQAIFDAHRRGAFTATHVRYPIIYGPRAVLAFERWVVRRLLDGRVRLILPDGGLGIFSRCADKNAAHLIGCVLDHPAQAAGQLYQCADDVQYSLLQWTQLIGAALGIEPQIVPVPLRWARPVWTLLPTGPLASPHTLVDTTKARRDLGYADVVEPAVALTELVHLLADDPAQTNDVVIDIAQEDAVIALYDEMSRRVEQALPPDHVDEASRRWHPYDHPRSPVL